MRKAICGKLKSVIDLTIKMINYIELKVLKTGILNKKTLQKNSPYEVLVLNTEIR